MKKHFSQLEMKHSQRSYTNTFLLLVNKWFLKLFLVWKCSNIIMYWMCFLRKESTYFNFQKYLKYSCWLNTFVIYSKNCVPKANLLIGCQTPKQHFFLMSSNLHWWKTLFCSLWEFLNHSPQPHTEFCQKMDLNSFLIFGYSNANTFATENTLWWTESEFFGVSKSTESNIWKKLGLAESRLNTAAVKKRGEGERVMVEVNAERSIPLIEIRF